MVKLNYQGEEPADYETTQKIETVRRNNQQYTTAPAAGA
jgi:hypothetical protein